MHIFVKKPRRSTTAPAFIASICKPIQHNCIFQAFETHPSKRFFILPYHLHSGSIQSVSLIQPEKAFPERKKRIIRKKMAASSDNDVGYPYVNALREENYANKKLHRQTRSSQNAAVQAV
jgi:hypothetical protein